MEQVLVSGSAGFIGGYVVEELLSRGYAVVGLDNFSKYGKVRKSYDDNPRYRLVEGDARDVGLMTRLLADCDYFIAGAAMIGGISYFHTYAYDLLATNERIIAASCDAAIAARRDGRLRKVTYLSSSMVFESADEWPSYEGRAAGDSAAAVVLRIPEAGGGVFRPGRLGSVQASLHPRAPVQLRGHRREPGPGRPGDPVRQRRARDEPRRPRPGAEGAQGPGPAAHPRFRRPGTALHLRRRSGRGGGDGDGARGRPQRGLQPVDGGEHHGPAAGRTDLAQGQGRTCRCGSSTTTRSSTTSSAGCPTRKRPRRCSASRPPPRSTRCSTRSSPGSTRPSRREPSES